jgi:thiol-disulfide isomerase/thioredoxin
MRKTKNYKSNNYRKKFNKTIKNRYNKSANKRTFKGRSKTVVGKIYANWCGYCQMMQNDWEKMKTDLAKGGSFEIMDIEQKNEVDHVNAVNEKYLKKSVTKVALQGGYPTVFKIKNGKLSYFNGERTYDAMKKWCLG